MSRGKLSSVLRCTLAVVSCFSMTSRVSGTSIIVELHKDRIILVADARRDCLKPNTPAGRHNYHDDACKIVILGGHAAAAIAGNLDYVRNDPSDRIPDWNSLLDAKESFKDKKGDLLLTAADWAQRAKAHYELFYSYAPQRVRSLASANPQRILVDAFFTGWNGGDGPILVWEKVYLDEGSPVPIGISPQALPIRDLPYTNDAVTHDLIEGNSERTRTAAAKWQSISQKVSTQQRHWRWLEFLIKSTHDYEEGVGEKVNVLRIVKNRQTTWLQNLTCKN